MQAYPSLRWAHAHSCGKCCAPTHVLVEVRENITSMSSIQMYPIFTNNAYNDKKKIKKKKGHTGEYILCEMSVYSYFFFFFFFYVLQSKLNSSNTDGSFTMTDMNSFFSPRKHTYLILTPLKPILYSKTGVYRGIHYFSYFCSKHRLWVFVRTASARRF